MGGEPYWYFERYQADVEAALHELRQREFAAGRYSPVIDSPSDLFPLGPNSPAPGAGHASIEEVMEEVEEEGTRSILDLDHVADEPDFCAVAPFPDHILADLYGTTQPTREMVEQNMDFLESIMRGQGAYIILYKNG